MPRYAWLASVVVLFAVSTAAEYEERYRHHYTDEFGVEVKGGLDDLRSLAKEHGLRIKRHLTSLGRVYALQHKTLSSRSKRSAEDLLDILKNDPRVTLVEQQQVLLRTKRRVIHDKQWELPIGHRNDKSIYQRYSESVGHPDIKNKIPGAVGRIKEPGFNDPYFPDQWYLINEGQTGGKVGYDVNVLPVWQSGITGQGVVVSILDDGIDHKHPDLKDNYDPIASADMNDRDDRENDPMPNAKDSSNSHGTRCAGEVAAQANNSNCGVGIAYNAHIGGVRMLDGTVTDLLEAEALTYRNQHIDIYSASWGPSDDGKTIEKPGPFAEEALRRGVTEGRGGLGSVFVWATGNGGVVDDDCSCDGYVSSIYTLSVGCISDRGLSTYFSEVCPSTMAVIFTGGAHQPPGVGYHRDNPKIKVVTTDLEGDCTLEFQGTSSAAPLAAGCFALVLEANPSLTWRDLQYLVVHTARIPNAEEEGWTVNGAGHHVNHKFGFGAIDCGRMVEAGRSWQTVGAQRQCEVAGPGGLPIEIHEGETVTTTLTTSGCHDDPEHEITRLEHVQIHIRVTHERRGALSIWLTSPSGTRSQVLSPRPPDHSSEGLTLTTMTVHCWGEDPAGDWEVSVTDTGEGEGRVRGSLEGVELTLWGVGGDAAVPVPGDQRRTGAAGEVVAHEAEQNEVKSIMAEEEEGREEEGREEEESPGGEPDLQRLFEEILDVKDGYAEYAHRQRSWYPDKSRLSSARRRLADRYPGAARDVHQRSLLDQAIAEYFPPKTPTEKPTTTAAQETGRRTEDDDHFNDLLAEINELLRVLED